MTQFSPVYFNHPGFMRLEKAPSAEYLEQWLSSALSRFIVLSRYECHIYAPYNLYLHARSDVFYAFSDAEFDTVSFLGFLGDQAIFSIVVDGQHDSFYSLNSLNYSLIDRISQPVLAAYVFAQFHAHTKFCYQCGGALTFLDITRTHLRCAACKRDVYPTISPCVIFTVYCADQLLVGHRYKNVFTNFSGFLEVAECPQQAVLREFEEETGIPRSLIKRCTDLQMEQPWGNQYGQESLMLCYAIELSSIAQVTPTAEISQFKWVTYSYWQAAARRTDGASYQDEHETWNIPKIGTVARWMMEKAWDEMQLWEYP